MVGKHRRPMTWFKRGKSFTLSFHTSSAPRLSYSLHIFCANLSTRKAFDRDTYYYDSNSMVKLTWNAVGKTIIDHKRFTVVPKPVAAQDAGGHAHGVS
jgi:hypothetical protein